jgi:hypothetical protein
MSVVAGLGLWEYSASNLALDRGRRPEDISDFTNVTGVFGDRDQSEGTPVLCVDHRENPSVVYTADGTPRQVEACYAWRGQDALFQYRHHAETGAQALALAANGPFVTREIVAGQFTDRVAIGAPQPVQGTLDLMVPTAFGASLLNENGQTSAVYSHADILGIATLPNAGTSILTRSGVFPVALRTSGAPESCPSLPQVLARVPQDHTVQSITVRGSNLVHLRGTGPDGGFLASARCDDDLLLVSSQEFIVSDRIRHIAVLRQLEDATQTVLVKQATDGRLVLTDGRSRHVPLDGVSGTLIGVYGTSQPRAAVILTDQDAYLLDMDAAISALGVADIDSELASSIEARPFGQVLDTLVIDTSPTPPVRPAERPRDPPPNIPQDSSPSEQSGQPPAAADVESLTQADPSADAIAYALAAEVAAAEVIVDLSAANRATAIEVQIRLKSLGYYVGEIDGDAGPMTRAAISAFQRSIGMLETGNLMQQQYEQLTGGSE